ncbi:MAG TPA: undecaprenyl-phosphate glucose phosphotransferase [Alphaproteobacteria bacterium]|nr:undecaprenyl-phosphate glucose phosphotransferase [Alphaproteobacteria bacterium]
MFRLDPKQALLDHVAAQAAARNGPAVLSETAKRIIAAPIERTYSGAVIVGIAQAIEALLLATLGFAIHSAYVAADGGLYISIILGAVIAANVAFNAAKTHRIAAYRTLAMQMGRVLAAWSVIFTVIAVGVFLFKASDYVSRVWLVSWFAAGAIVLVLFRLSLRALIQQWTREGKLKRRTVIVGGGRDAEALIEAIRRSAENDVRLFGLFDDRDDDRSPAAVAGLPKLGKVSDLIEFARLTRVDLVIVSMPLSAEKRVLEMLKQLWVLPVDIRLSAHMSKLRFTSKAYSYLGEVPVFDVADRPISDWNLVFKWLFDKIVALTAIILLSPVMIVTAIAIKLESKGPVIFKQKRHGFNNELIEVYKFRSMYTDRSDANAAKLVTRDDPRVTRVGRFIRKTSIDELPQFFNVLKGDLSVVGPRPHALQAKAENKLYYEAVDGYFARHKVKPGVTGWAQINGWRGETDTVDKIMQRVHHDLYYIENWSIFLDLYILFMTPFSLISKNENAF